MKTRQYEKLWIKARITWICDRYGTVERGYLADYFTMFPNDWKRVRKMLRQRKDYRTLYMLNKDVKNQYKHPSYKKKKILMIFVSKLETLILFDIINAKTLF